MRVIPHISGRFYLNFYEENIVNGGPNSLNRLWNVYHKNKHLSTEPDDSDVYATLQTDGLVQEAAEPVCTVNWTVVQPHSIHERYG